MSQISPKGEQSTEEEIELLTALNDLAVSPSGQFIRKTGITLFENADPVIDVNNEIATHTILINANSASIAALDSTYLKLDASNDPITNPLEGIVMIDTKANILADTPASNKLAFATDTDEFYLYDTNDSEWKVAPLELKADSATPDMGAYDMKQAGYLGLGVSDHSGYYDDWITDKSLSNIKLLQSVIDEEGSIRTTTSGVFQVYLNGVWNDVVINFRLREDNSGAYEFEHMPIGFTEWIEIMSGNSDKLDLDGRPMLLQYSSSMGAYQVPLLLEGGQF